MPTSVSPGLPMMRPTTSEISRSALLPKKENGIIRRISDPRKRRIRCGTIRPTKPIGPARAVVAPQSRALAAVDALRTNFTFTPRADAASSPSARAFKDGARHTESRNPTAMNGKISRTLSVVARPILPTVQKRKFCMTASFGSMMVLTKEPSVIATADPDSASFSGVAPSFPSEAMPYTSRVVSSAPRIASQIY